MRAGRGGARRRWSQETLRHVHADHDGRRNHDQHPGTGHCPQHLPLVARSLLPEVDQDHPDAVERVIEHRGHQAQLHQADDRGLVGLDHLVVGLRADPYQRGIEDMDEQEEEDGRAGDAVQHPRPHAGVAAVEGASSRRLDPGGGSRHCRRRHRGLRAVSYCCDSISGGALRRMTWTLRSVWSSSHSDGRLGLGPGAEWFQ